MNWKIQTGILYFLQNFFFLSFDLGNFKYEMVVSNFNLHMYD